MEEPKLLAFIREIADSEKKSIRENADSDIESITRESIEKADAMRESVRDSVRGEADRLRERRQNAVKFQAIVKRYELKAQAIKDVWYEVEKKLEEIERSDTYPEILEDLVKECFNRVPEDAVFSVNPSDAEMVKTCLKREGRSYDVVENGSVHGGVSVRWPDGKTVLMNTLKNRLERLKAEGDDEIAHKLFAGEKETPTL